MTILAKRQVIVPDVGGEGQLWGVSNRPLIDTTQSVFPPPPIFFFFLNNFEYISRSDVIETPKIRDTCLRTLLHSIQYFFLFFFFFLFILVPLAFLSPCVNYSTPPQRLRNNGSQSPEHSTEL